MALHAYERSPHSHAGNCVCGMDYESRAHWHPYTKAYRSELCVCAYPADHPIHDAPETRSEQRKTAPCRTFVSGGTVYCCEEGETDCPCVCHEPGAAS